MKKILLLKKKVLIMKLIALIIKEMKEEEQSVHRSIWTLAFWDRGGENSHFQTLFRDLRAEGDDFFRNLAHIPHEDFQFLCEKLRPVIGKQDTNMRLAITVEERLALTLKYLANGDSYNTLSQLFRISRPSIVVIIPEVCDALFKIFSPDYLKTPSTETEWLKIADEFEKQWNFPNCVGALDGKHVVCKSPANSGSTFYNYKGTHSVVLMAVVDANYKFIYINVGGKGSASDGGIYSSCPFNVAMQNNSLHLPPDRPLPGRTLPMPFCIVADAAFAASKRIMKPIGSRNLSTLHRVYNYRLSRARRVVENAFGIASARWRVLRKPFEQKPDTITKIVSAVCVLHNFCIDKRREYLQNIVDIDHEGEITPGQWRLGEELIPLQQQQQSETMHSTTIAREEYISYFTSECGELQWQYSVR